MTKKNACSPRVRYIRQKCSSGAIPFCTSNSCVLTLKMSSDSVTTICAVLLLYTMSQMYPISCTTKYYVTRNELKKRHDDQKKIVKDPIHMSNSNTYFVEDGYGYDSQEVANYEGADVGYGYDHRYVAIEKKHSKIFGDEISFVIVVITLTVFFGILSSLLIPLTLMLINGGVLGGGLGFGGLGGLTNGILPVIGQTGLTGALGTGLIGRRRRSVALSERAKEFEHRFDTAVGKYDK